MPARAQESFRMPFGAPRFAPLHRHRQDFLRMTSGDSLVWGNSMASTARKILLAGAALASLTFTQAAQAGGIGIHEQSASGQGMSFAGEGTSSMGLSGMFWNPAAVTQATGLWTESHVAFLFGHTVETALPGSTPLGVPTNSGNI